MDVRNHWKIICLLILCRLSELICEAASSDSDMPLASYASLLLDHPDKSGYQTQQLGSEKHDYGYVLKSSGKHFHHTSTEKDGVRLGCFGYELEGKMYITQYVADARGYRLVTNQDLISVYPKSGSEGKAGFIGNFNEDDDDRPRNVRYFFPKGCKGIDVQIDNSSRLRSLKLDDKNPRLPVTLKPANALGDAYYTRPPQHYPGPSNIYAPSLVPIQTARPPTSYLHHSQKPPPPPSNSNYARPPPSNSNYARPPPPSVPPTPATTPPSSPKPDNTYLPPLNNTYLPPPMPSNAYLPPQSNSSSSSPCGSANSSESPPPPIIAENAIDNSYVSPPVNTNNNNNNNKPTYQGGGASTGNHISELLPPKEPDCPGTIQYCDSSNGCLVIPIELKNRNNDESCCASANYAKLILPLKHFDEDTVKRITEAVPRELDANDLIRNILDNLL